MPLSQQVSESKFPRLKIQKQNFIIIPCKSDFPNCVEQRDKFELTKKTEKFNRLVIHRKFEDETKRE